MCFLWLYTLEPVQRSEGGPRQNCQNQNRQQHGQNRGACGRSICIDFRMKRRRVDVVSRLTVFAQVPRVAFDRLALVVVHTLRVGLNKAAIENAARQTFVIIRFDCFEIMDGDAGLIADFAQANAALLAGESQLFAYTRCHLHSLDSWRRVGWIVTPGLSARRLYETYNSHFFCTIACAAKRCQTFASQKISVSCFLPLAVVR